MAKQPKTAPAPETDAEVTERFTQQAREQQINDAEQATKTAADQGRLPESMAVTNPAPSTTMDAASGAFIEPEIVKSIPVDHPSVENNPREGTSAVQNGGDFNDPLGRNPGDPGFIGQGLDLSVYGKS